MKTKSSNYLVTAACGLTVLFAFARAETSPATGAVLPPLFAVVSMTATAPAPEPAPAATPVDPATVRWSDIKDLGYDQRVRFLAGLKRLEARVDDEVGELVAQRAAMSGKNDTKEWDFAMKEMVNAQSYLKSTGVESAAADLQTWDQLREKVGQAWVRTQDAYKNVRATTTSN